MDKVLVDLFFGFSFLVVNFSIFGVLDDGLIKLDENKLLFEILKMLELVVEELELESKFIDVLFK